MEIRALGPGDDEAVAAAQHLFDGPARADATARFLGEPGSQLLVGYVDGEPAGFVSGVEVTHPDKGTRCSSTSSRSTRRTGGAATGAR